jgi:hypothetical protein
MRALSAGELVDAWEQGQTEPPIRRALMLLAVACSETPETLASLSVGERDGRLLTLREWLFGPQLTGLATCSNCGERVEVTFNAADVRVGPGRVSPGDRLVSADGYDMWFRLPDSADLAAAGAQDDMGAARQLLLERCVEASRGGERITPSQLPGPVIAALEARMAQVDPQADVQLCVSCPRCTRRWEVAFDIVSFLWSEINAWALRTLNDVHVLACAYGWREADILNLSAWRRRFYLDLVSA